MLCMFYAYSVFRFSAPPELMQHAWHVVSNNFVFLSRVTDPPFFYGKN
jgi:hypothetical protein